MQKLLNESLSIFLTTLPPYICLVNLAFVVLISPLSLLPSLTPHHSLPQAGVHRVQRVPITDGAGKVQTSTATVAVMPEVRQMKS